MVEFNSGLQAEFRAEQAALDEEARQEKLAADSDAMQEQLAIQMQVASQMESAMSSAFYNSLMNGQSLWDGLVEGFANMLAQMAAQMAARAAIFGLFDMFTGGAFGAATGGLSNYVFRAGGGPYEAGDNLITQERRAEAIIPRGPGRVAPTAKGGDTINIIVQNPAQAYSTARQLRKDQRSRNTGIN